MTFHLSGCNFLIDDRIKLVLLEKESIHSELSNDIRLVRKGWKLKKLWTRKTFMGRNKSRYFLKF